MEDSRNIIKAIDALTLKAGGEVVNSKNITEAIDKLRAVYDESAIGIDKTLTQEGVAADAKAVGDKISRMLFNDTIQLEDTSSIEAVLRGISSYIYEKYVNSDMPFFGNVFVKKYDAYTVMGSVRNNVIKAFVINTNATAYCIVDNKNPDRLSFVWYALGRES